MNFNYSNSKNSFHLKWSLNPKLHIALKVFAVKVHINGPARRSSSKDKLDGPTLQTCQADRLDQPIQWISQTQQLDTPPLYFWNGQLANLKIEMYGGTLLQLPGLSWKVLLDELLPVFLTMPRIWSFLNILVQKNLSLQKVLVQKMFISIVFA